VTVRGRAGDRHTVTCDVVDHGPGVAPGARDAVFLPFSAVGVAGPGDRGAGNLGLGLAVARGFATAMGGSLLPLETPGGGLTMRLSLPQAGRSAP
jgi:two-component system sensor histidine kinase KdpD